MTGLSSASQSCRMAFGAMPGSTSAMSGGVLRSIRFPCSNDAESIRNRRWMVIAPSSEAALSRLGRVEITPSALFCSTHQRTATSSRPSPSARSMCTNAHLPASWAMRIISGSVRIDPPSRKIAAAGVCAARRTASGVCAEGMTGLFSNCFSRVCSIAFSSMRIRLWPRGS